MARYPSYQILQLNPVEQPCDSATDAPSKIKLRNLRSMPIDLVNYRYVYPWNTANTDIGYYFLLKIGSKKYNLAHSMAHWAYLPWPKSICLYKTCPAQIRKKENIFERLICLARLRFTRYWLLCDRKCCILNGVRLF